MSALELRLNLDTRDLPQDFERLLSHLSLGFEPIFDQLRLRIEQLSVLSARGTSQTRHATKMSGLTAVRRVETRARRWRTRQALFDLPHPLCA
ncbi:hypothetical protein XMIN_4429 [Xanthomonas citri pv. mangiferaeindicae LMG 941]|nr:hypothetical protein Xcnt_21845 [Xanthomonas campestris pv. centellae]CCG39436.1 hypothetical protein XMIN_4429 [Xanthomonas citri pv. mangiferaeindicae LMG 941]